MRCCAPVTDEAVLGKRASGSERRRCEREARFTVQTSRRRWKWFCYQHAGPWAAHYRILDRIRSL